MRYAKGCGVKVEVMCGKTEVMCGKTEGMCGNGGGKMCGMEGARGKGGVVW